jgi:hypothetical protein
MSIMRNLILLLLLLITACQYSPGPSRSKILNSWVSRNADELIIGWGRPESLYELSNGDKIYQFILSKTVSTPGKFEASSYGRSHNAVPLWENRDQISFVPPETHHYQCTTRFVISNFGIVKAWIQNDYDCSKFTMPSPRVDSQIHLGDETATLTKEHCNEFQQTINVGRKKLLGYGKSCLQPDGTWKIMR